MDKLQVALCEDEEYEREKLCSLILASAVPVQIWSFDNGEDFLKGYESGTFDVIFMDIYLDGISGVEAVRRVRVLDEHVPIAFITTSREHALDGYRLNVAKYMEKPVTSKAVNEMLELALDKKGNPPGITVLLNGKPFTVPVHKLLYVEQKAHYLIFYLLGGRTIQTRGKLDDLMPQAEPFPLFRCHKSFLANLSFVTGVDREFMLFHMKEGNDVYIRRENFKAAKNAWESWLFEITRKGGPGNA